MDSLNTLSPRELLDRYRRLCELAGEARATGRPLAFADRADLYLVERALLLRLDGRSEKPSGGTAEGPLPAETPPLTASRAGGPEAAPGQPTPEGQRTLFGPPDERSEPAAPTQALEAPRAAPAIIARENGSEAIRSGPARVYADGACQGNPGPGGYGVIVRVPGKPDREMSGGSPSTTNNQMEMTGAIVGIRQAIQDGATEIVVTSDSEYLVKGMKSWLAGWERKGWKTSAGQPVKNRELWETLSQLTRGRNVTWNWIRGHAGHPENERCDELAVAAARQASLQRRNGR